MSEKLHNSLPLRGYFHRSKRVEIGPNQADSEERSVRNCPIFFVDRRNMNDRRFEFMAS